MVSIGVQCDDMTRRLLDTEENGRSLWWRPIIAQDEPWIRWGSHWLSFGCFAALLGFFLADLTFIVELAENRLVSIPSTVSAAMSSNVQTSGTIYAAFMQISSLSILISFYPFTLPNASCRCKIYSTLSYRKLRWVAPSFFTLLVLIPTKVKGNDVILIIQRAVHQFTAFMAFFLMLWPEVHTLQCQDRPEMTPGELRGRKLWAYGSIFFFTSFLTLQIVWLIGVRIPILNMASFACEVQGSVCAIVCLLHIWHFNSPDDVTREETGDLPAWDFIPKSIYAGSTFVFILICIALFIVHIVLVGSFWSPSFATMNCIDSNCAVCITGVSHSMAGSGECSILSTNEVFWSSKLGLACWCDNSYLVSQLSTAGDSSFAINTTWVNAVHVNSTKQNATMQNDTIQNNTKQNDVKQNDVKQIDIQQNNTKQNKLHSRIQRNATTFIYCKKPAYPYTVVTSLEAEPLVAMTFQGCAIDDVRKLHDPSLALLARPGNPVEVYSARSIACARVPVVMTGQQSDAYCDRSPASDSDFRVYCVDSSGNSRGFFDGSRIVGLANAVCHISSGTGVGG